MPFSAVANATISSLSGILTPVDPIYVADYSTLRGITTGSLLAFITGKFSDGTANDSIAGWFQADPNDHTTVEDGFLTIVATSGMRWKRILATDSTLLNLELKPLTKNRADPLPWTVPGTKIIFVAIDGIVERLTDFTIVGNVSITAIPSVMTDFNRADIYYL